MRLKKRGQTRVYLYTGVRSFGCGADTPDCGRGECGQLSAADRAWGVDFHIREQPGHGQGGGAGIAASNQPARQYGFYQWNCRTALIRFFIADQCAGSLPDTAQHFGDYCGARQQYG